MEVTARYASRMKPTWDGFWLAGAGILLAAGLAFGLTDIPKCGRVLLGKSQNFQYQGFCEAAWGDRMLFTWLCLAIGLACLAGWVVTRSRARENRTVT